MSTQLCFFRPDVPELGRIIGSELVENFKNSSSEEDEKCSLRACFTKLMSCDPDSLRTELEALVARVETMGTSRSLLVCSTKYYLK